MNFSLKQEKHDIFKSSLLIGLALLLSYLVIFFASNFIYALLYVNGNNTNKIVKIFNDNYYGYFFNSAIMTIAFVFPILLIKCATKEPIYVTARFNKPNKYWFLMIFFVLGMAMIANYATGIFDKILETVFNFTPVQPEIGDNGYNNRFELLFILVNSALIPALIEEFTFRGVILGSLRKYGDTPAIIISALLFAFFHQNFVQIPFAFLVGIALGISFVVTESIWVGIIAHFLNNALALLLNELSKTYFWAAAIVIYAVLIIGILSFVFLKKLKAFKIMNKQVTNLSNASKFFRMLFNPTIIVFILFMCYLSLFNRA
ncbi:MAG: CPBP family intramembrane metalloprotease [Clostridia bacterium]|nr:CPBP family intramembrane metalloprotease [Clostridia bacterium]